MERLIDRIVAYIAAHPGATDGQITGDLGIKHHAQANQRCRQLESEGLVERRRVNGLICNFPNGSQPSTQAGHWFSNALFDIVVWRGEDPDVGLAMALPDFQRYRALAEKTEWLQSAARSSFLWVKENGSVLCLSPVLNP